MKRVSVVRAAMLLGVAVLVGMLGFGAQSASGAPEGGFDRVQTTAFAEGTAGSIDFVVTVDRTIKHQTDPVSAVGWGIEVEFDGEEFETGGKTARADFDIKFSQGWATVETDLEGCGEVEVTWEASGEEFRSDNTWIEGEGVEVRVVESVKLTDVEGTVCDEEIDTVEENAQIIVEAGYCRGDLTKRECKDLGDDVPSAPEA